MAFGVDDQNAGSVLAQMRQQDLLQQLDASAPGPTSALATYRQSLSGDQAAPEPMPATPVQAFAPAATVAPIAQPQPAAPSITPVPVEPHAADVDDEAGRLARREGESRDDFYRRLEISEMSAPMAGLYGASNQAASIAAGAGAVVADAVGADDTKEWFIKHYRQGQENAAPYSEGRPVELGDIDSVGDAASFAGYHLGAAVPFLAESLVGAVVGGAVGSAVGPGGTIAGAAAGAIARKARNEGIKGAINKMTARHIARELGDTAVDALTKEARDAVVRRAAKKTAGDIGALTGAFATSYQMGLGDVYGTTLGDDEIDGNAGMAALWAVPYAALELIPEIGVARRLMGRATGAKVQNAGMRMLMEGVKTGAKEGATESAQEMINIGADMMDNNAIYTGEQIMSRLGNAFAAGGVMGVGMGAVGGVRQAATPEEQAQMLDRGITSAEQIEEFAKSAARVIANEKDPARRAQLQEVSAQTIADTIEEGRRMVVAGPQEAQPTVGMDRTRQRLQQARRPVDEARANVEQAMNWLNEQAAEVERQLQAGGIGAEAAGRRFGAIQDRMETLRRNSKGGGLAVPVGAPRAGDPLQDLAGMQRRVRGAPRGEMNAISGATDAQQATDPALEKMSRADLQSRLDRIVKLGQSKQITESDANARRVAILEEMLGRQDVGAQSRAAEAEDIRADARFDSRREWFDDEPGPIDVGDSSLAVEAGPLDFGGSALSKDGGPVTFGEDPNAQPTPPPGDDGGDRPQGGASGAQAGAAADPTPRRQDAPDSGAAEEPNQTTVPPVGGAADGPTPNDQGSVDASTQQPEQGGAAPPSAPTGDTGTAQAPDAAAETDAGAEQAAAQRNSDGDAESRLRGNKSSIPDYLTEKGIDPDVFERRSGGVVAEARKSVPYLMLMDEMREVAGKLKKAKAVLPLIATIERHWENPFTSKLADARDLPPVLRRRLKRKFDGVESGDAAKRAYRDAEYKLEVERAIEFAKATQQPNDQPNQAKSPVPENEAGDDAGQPAPPADRVPPTVGQQEGDVGDGETPPRADVEVSEQADNAPRDQGGRSVVDGEGAAADVEPATLTAEATDLLKKIEGGKSIPLTVTRNLKRIARANGVEVPADTGAAGAQQVVEALRRKVVAAGTGPVQSAQTPTGAETATVAPTAPKPANNAVDAKADSAQGKELWQMTRAEAIAIGEEGRKERHANAPFRIVNKETGEFVREVPGRLLGKINKSKYRVEPMSQPIDPTEDNGWVGNVEASHRQAIDLALSKGRSVSPDVLADYPEIRGDSQESKAQGNDAVDTETDSGRKFSFAGRTAATADKHALGATHDASQSSPVIDPSAKLTAAPARHMRAAQLQSAVDAYASDLLGPAADLVKVRVVQSQDEAMGPASRDQYGIVNGYFDPAAGEVVLVADNIPNMRQARRIIRHEAVAHFGWSAMSDADKAELATRIQAATRVNKKIKALWGEEAAKDTKRTDAVVAEEVFARVTEDVADGFTGRAQAAWDRVLTFVRDALAKVGLVSPETTPAAMRVLARRLAQGMREGRVVRGEDGEVMFSAEKAPPTTARDVSRAKAKELDDGQKVTLYRAMTLIDGKLYPPMSSKMTDAKGKLALREPEPVGKWQRSEEKPELVPTDGRYKGQFPLKKSGGGTTWALYAPYFHASPIPLNDQFTAAWKNDGVERPQIVTVEVEIPESELSSGYKAEGSVKTVGANKWNSGVVASKVPGGRAVMLSRYIKIKRVVPDSEVAEKIAELVNPHRLQIPENTVTPQLRAELEKQGVRIAPKGTKGDDIRFSATGQISQLPDTIDVDGTERPTRNSEGQPIHTTEDGARNFWKSYDGPTDKDGRPVVMYHATTADFSVFDLQKGGPVAVTPDAYYAEDYIQGGGGNRGRAEPLLHDFESGSVWEQAEDDLGQFVYRDQFGNEMRPDAAERMVYDGDLEVWSAGGAVMPLYANVKKPLDFANKKDVAAVASLDPGSNRFAQAIVEEAKSGAGLSWQSTKGRFSVEGWSSLIPQLEAQGYDGLAFIDDGGTQPQTYMVFRSGQIKSAIGSTGAFSPTNPDIRFSLASDIKGLLQRNGSNSNDPYARQNARIKEQDKTLAHKAKLALRRALFPGGNLPKPVFDTKIERDSELGVTEMDTRSILAHFEDAFKAEYGKPARKATQEEIKALNAALRTSADLGTLKPETRARVLAMREYIGHFSERIANLLERQIADLEREAVGMTSQEAEALLLSGSDVPEAQRLRAVAAKKKGTLEAIRDNMDEYVHRSYQAFDDKNWFKRVPAEALNNARAFITQERELYAQELDDRSQMAAADGDTDKAAALREKATYLRDPEKVDNELNAILKAGTAYSDVISFLGESKLGAMELTIFRKRKDIPGEIRELWGEHKDPRLNFARTVAKQSRFVENQLFLERIKEIGQGEWLFDKRDEAFGATAQIPSSDSYSPIEGMWTTPEIAQAFEDATGKESLPDWYRAAVRVNGAIKWGMTIGSPTTQARNFMSATFFAITNGHFDFRHGATAAKAFGEYLHSKDEGKFYAYLRKLKKLGVVYDTPYAEELKKLLDDSEIADTLAPGGRAEFNKWTNLAQRVYSYSDDFFKLIGFENEKALLMKHKGMSEADAEVAAAERIRNTYPTYSMTGRFVNQLRRFPLAGTFVSFPSEIIRTTYHILNYAAQDMKDPALRPLAIRRLIGIAMGSGAIAGAQAIMMAALDVDDEEEEAFRELAAPWQKNSNILPIYRSDDGRLSFVDMSFLDPYNFFKRPINAIMRDEPWESKAKEVAREVFSPFFGTDILFGAVVEAATNQKKSGGRVFNPHDTVLAQTGDIVDHMRKSIQPGAASLIERTYKAASGQISPSGKEYSMPEEAAGAVGFRITTFDPKTALYYKTFEFQDAKRDATGILNSVMRDPNAKSERAIRSALRRSLRARRKAYKEMVTLVAAAQKSGLSRRATIAALRNSGVPQSDIQPLLNGTMPQWKFPRQAMRNADRKAKLLFGDEVARDIQERGDTLRQIAGN